MVLEPDDFAIGPEGPDPAPADLVDRGTWRSLTLLPDDVAVKTSSHHGTFLRDLSDLCGPWTEVAGDLQDGIFGQILDADGEFQASAKLADAADVLSYREGIGSTVKVFRDKHGEKLVSIDGFPVAGTTRGMLDAQESLGNVPLLLSRVTSPHVGLIGFGAGGASWESLQYDVAGVDCVELVPAVIAAATWFPEINHDVLHAPRYRVIMGDGRNYAMIASRQYDVISVDATTPKMAGDGSLYTLEFYRLIARRLSPDGLAVQWLPFHLLSPAEARMTARTFLAAFPHTTLWLSPLRYHGLLVGSREPLHIDVQALRRKMERPGVRQGLARVGVHGPVDFLAEFVMNEDALRRYVDGGPLNTDNHPYLEFTPAWSYVVALRYALENLAGFQQHRQSAVPLLDQGAEHLIGGGGQRLRPLLLVLPAPPRATPA